MAGIYYDTHPIYRGIWRHAPPEIFLNLNDQFWSNLSQNISPFSNKAFILKNNQHIKRKIYNSCANICIAKVKLKLFIT